MKITEAQLRKIVEESIKSMLSEEAFGLSFGNFVKNGHLHVNSKSANPVIREAWKYGWELKKADENEIEGEYAAAIMDGVFNGVEPDDDIRLEKHPKASWPMLIAMLNKEFRPQGYYAAGSNYRMGFEDIMGRESSDPEGGAKRYYGTITIRKVK